MQKLITFLIIVNITILMGCGLMNKMITTKSGLKYEILEEGKEKIAKTGDTVTVSYTGYLMDGTKFDSNEYFTFKLGAGNVIPPNATLKFEVRLKLIK